MRSYKQNTQHIHFSKFNIQVHYSLNYAVMLRLKNYIQIKFYNENQTKMTKNHIIRCHLFYLLFDRPPLFYFTPLPSPITNLLLIISILFIYQSCFCFSYWFHIRFRNHEYFDDEFVTHRIPILNGLYHWQIYHLNWNRLVIIEVIVKYLRNYDTHNNTEKENLILLIVYFVLESAPFLFL